MNKNLATILVMLALAILLTGCPSKPVDEQEAGVGVDDRTGTGTGGAETAGLPGQGGYTAADLNDPSSPLYQRVIYFEYDRSEIQPQFLDVLRAHAAYLGSSQGTQVTLEGHADERGTREYNLALGEQRADTVRRFLLAEGVADSQINMISYGEERAADPSHSESAWALNRRVELVY